MYIHPAGNVQRPGWVPFTSRGQDGMPILRFLVEAAQADRRGSVQAPISQVGAEPLQSVSGERRTSIPSCWSVFVRPAGLPSGSLTPHRSRPLAPIRFVQGVHPLRRSAAIPLTLSITFSLLVMRSMEPHRQVCSTKRKADGPGLGGTPTRRIGKSKRISRCLACPF